MLMDLETIEIALIEIEGVMLDKYGGETLKWRYRTLLSLWRHIAGHERPKVR
jgi:hypothetical protein